MKGWLFRHGSTYGNTRQRYIGRTDEPLVGEETDALPRLAEQWKAEGRIPATQSCLFVSPLLRCRQTARLFYPEAEQIVISDLRECDFGDFENKNYKELAGNSDYQRWIDSNGTLPFPNGESGEVFRSRCRAGFLEALRLARKKQLPDLALFVHGGTIMSILEAYGTPRKSYYDWHLKNGEGWAFTLTPGGQITDNSVLLRVEKKISR